MGKVYKKGIVTPKGINLSEPEPVDQRDIVEYHSDLFNLDNAYLGIEVKVREEGYQKYRLVKLPITTNNNWILLNVKGEKGTAGKSSGSVGLTYIQTASSKIWVVNHNLNKFPLVTIIDSSNIEIEGEVIHIDNNTLQITFNEALTGTVILN